LCRQLVALGASATAVDNLVNGRRENLDELVGCGCKLVVADILDPEELQPLLATADVVFHLACLGVRHSIHSGRENHEVNATGTLQLLDLARHVECPRFVYVSTSEVYGTATVAPLTERHPTTPMTVYGASKLAAESYTRAFYRTYGMQTVVVRPLNAYGPRCHHEGDSGEVIPKFMLRCLAGRPMIIFGDGSQTRDFTFVSDTARGILTAGFSPNAIGETINLGQNQEIQIRDLAREVALAVGISDPRIDYQQSRPGDCLRLYADTSHAQDLLEFKPRVGLREGLELLHKWYDGQDLSPQQLLGREQVRNWELPV